jgi:hypothetical protein
MSQTVEHERPPAPPAPMHPLAITLPMGVTVLPFHVMREQALERAIDLACDQAGPPVTNAQRSPTHVLSGCRCAVPEPLQTGTDNPPTMCMTCDGVLNLDTAGQPYRRFPGDITSPAMQLQRQAKRAQAEMMQLIEKLPQGQRRRLLKLSREHPAQFHAEARRIILAQEQQPTLGGNARRRLERKRSELAEIADRVIDERRAMFAGEGRGEVYAGEELLGTLESAEIETDSSEHEPISIGDMLRGRGSITFGIDLAAPGSSDRSVDASGERVQQLADDCAGDADSAGDDRSAGDERQAVADVQEDREQREREQGSADDTQQVAE